MILHDPINAVSSDSTGSASNSDTSSVVSSDPSSTEPVSTVVMITPSAGANTDTVLFDPDGVGSPEIDGESYVLYNADTLTFLLGKNPDAPLPPASITKVMTVLLALENLKMTDTITVTRDMYESIPTDYVRLGLVEGEVITVEEAIYACLLISANDAAMALAMQMGGSVEGFADMMNQRSVALGCTHTHFTNPYGFADPEHLTTAHDMALIMSEALKHPEYSKISTTANYSLPATNKRPDPLNLRNINKFISTTDFAYDNYIGGKTGYTDMSGHTITAGARMNNRTLVAVILGASTSNSRYENLIHLFDYGFATYSSYVINPSDYSALQTTAIDQIGNSIKSASYPLIMKEVKLELQPFLTVTAARAAGGYTDKIDVSGAVIVADKPVQKLSLPVTRTFSDGSSETLGSLQVTICDDEAANNPSLLNEQKPMTAEEIGQIVLQVTVVLLLTIVLSIVIILFLRLQRAKNRRRNRRKPKVL